MNGLWIVAMLVMWPMLAAAGTWSGKVVTVEAGDRLTVKIGKKLVKVRLAGIETLSTGSRGARASRQYLAELCRNRKAALEAPVLPARGVVTGKVLCNWTKKAYADAGYYQVDQGMARLLASETDPELVRAQARAQSRCVGLWADLLPQCGTTNPTKPNGFTCDGRIYCSQMRSCSEARFFLNNCPGTKMDGDNDGIPCEQQWCP